MTCALVAASWRGGSGSCLAAERSSSRVQTSHAFGAGAPDHEGREGWLARHGQKLRTKALFWQRKTPPGIPMASKTERCQD